MKAIENLMEKKGKFDYILLETTGLADPGPIAAMFWLDDELGSDIYLDGKHYQTSVGVYIIPCTINSPILFMVLAHVIIM